MRRPIGAQRFCRINARHLQSGIDLLALRVEIELPCLARGIDLLVVMSDDRVTRKQQRVGQLRFALGCWTNAAVFIAVASLASGNEPTAHRFGFCHHFEHLDQLFEADLRDYGDAPGHVQPSLLRRAVAVPRTGARET